jgi:ATP-dependent RNA helicase DBP3
MKKSKKGRSTTGAENSFEDVHVHDRDEPIEGGKRKHQDTDAKQKKKRRKDSDVVEKPATEPSPAAVVDFLSKHAIAIHTADSDKITPIISFAQLDIPVDLRSAFATFEEPTPIQACTWPPALQGRDLIGIAETGRQVSI